MAIIPVDLTTDEVVIDLLGWNNQYLQITFDMSAWLAVPDFDLGIWRMQVRSKAGARSLVLGMDGVFLTPYVIFYAPLSSSSTMLENYDWDFGFSLPASDFKRCAGGNLEMRYGVTR